jgi:hypothetical protein
LTSPVNVGRSFWLRLASWASTGSLNASRVLRLSKNSRRSAKNETNEVLTVSEFRRWRRNVLVGYVFLVLGFATTFLKVEGDQKQGNENAEALSGLVGRLQKDESSQLANRARNVTVWCSAINEGRDFDRRLVGTFHIPYGLGDLPCSSLAAATKKSAR